MNGWYCTGAPAAPDIANASASVCSFVLGCGREYLFSKRARERILFEKRSQTTQSYCARTRRNEQTLHRVQAC